MKHSESAGAITGELAGKYHRSAHVDDRHCAMLCATFFAASRDDKDPAKILGIYQTLICELDPKKPINVDWQRRDND